MKNKKISKEIVTDIKIIIYTYGLLMVLALNCGFSFSQANPIILIITFFVTICCIINTINEYRRK